MNYNFDTDMDREWSADQTRRSKNENIGLPDAPIRRITANLRQTGSAVLACDRIQKDATLGCALSALAVHKHNAEQCRQTCAELLSHLADRDRVALHQEFVRLRGMELVLTVVHDHPGPAALVALKIFDKLSRTSAREICAANAVDVLVTICETDEQAPRMLEVALRVLHGLTFDGEARLLLLRRGVRRLAETVVEAGPRRRLDPEDDESRSGEAWEDVLTIGTRLLQRLSDDRTSGRVTRGDVYTAARSVR